MKPAAFLLFLFAHLLSFSLHAQEEKRVEQRLAWLKPVCDSKDLKPESADLLYNVAALYALKGSNDSAFLYLFKAVDLCPDSLPECLEVYNADVLGDVCFWMLHKDSRWKLFEKKITAGFLKINSNITHPKLAFQLMLAKGYDQSVRFYYPYFDSKQKREISKRKGDSANLVLIKSVIEKYGFPTISMVGVAASNAAFLLAQHADKDLNFQKKVLRLMNKSGNDLNKSNIAYLTDRIMVAEEGKQLYGTQFISVQERKLYPIQDAPEVDARRKQMGLSTLNEYLNTFSVTGE